jgi:hypothetical protein
MWMIFYDFPSLSSIVLDHAQGVSVGKWIVVELELGKDYTSASVDGKLLTRTTKGASSGWNIKVALDRYQGQKPTLGFISPLYRMFIIFLPLPYQDQ